MTKSILKTKTAVCNQSMLKLKYVDITENVGNPNYNTKYKLLLTTNSI